MTLRRATSLLLLLVPGVVLGAGAKAYPSPESATEALLAAARTGDPTALAGVLGSGAKSMLASGDAVADHAAVRHFVELADQGHMLLAPRRNTRTLVVGSDPWPFPIPLVKAKAGWTFDTQAGQAEILARRVGQNELDAIQVCLGYVGAQREYLARNPEGASVPHYADRLMSTPGKRDGLYWPAAAGEPESPMGPAVSGAQREGYAPGQGKPAPYHGYRYRILTGQGPHAEGGARDYREGGKLTRGFGLVAYPASYRKSGVMAFLVNEAGVVFQKDLGPKTGEVAAALMRFDPDATWKPVAP
jgi:hypothetical protein